MVKKKEMKTGFETQIFNREMLKSSWKNQLIIFKKLNKSKITDYGFTNFIEWVLKTDYSNELFAASSTWRLLISKPLPNGQLNYQQTLKIELDFETLLYSMEYSDWDFIDNKEDTYKPITWKKKCIGIELIANFIEFINWNKTW
ncbi:hypothetical protein [Tenacibaculum sp. M341]|uniref:hypothetical protein n=1 Tax=Tenacibaculum sp. M341 TaxID=2530339 RepID=UPI00104C9EC4|nr:hypothetical protein [Tenacibaculum sp. M341]TCI85463.1 hypothetical protein EYW44_17085 [Tenacibaculum sp. M341]